MRSPSDQRVPLLSPSLVFAVETIASPLYEQVYAVSDSALNQATGLWFTYLGLVGLVVYAGMAVKRPKWAPSDFNLCIFSCTACAIGGLVLAHPGSPSLDKGSLNFGAVLIWSVGAPISDVVAVRAPRALAVSCASTILCRFARAGIMLFPGRKWFSDG